MPLAQSRCRICGGKKRVYSQICSKLDCFRAWRATVQKKRNGRALKEQRRWESLVKRNQSAAIAQTSDSEQLSATQ
jgi:hypothetical protein